MTIAYIIGILIVLYIVYKVLAAVGLVKTAAAKKKEAAEAAATTEITVGNFWQPDYWKTQTGFSKLGVENAKEFATDIHDSIYGFLKIGTNAAKIMTTFGRCYNKINVSEISDAYNQKYERDMQADLLNNLTDEHIAQLVSIVNNLPNR